MRIFLFRMIPLLALILLAGCESNQTIVSSISEREANEIVVYLSSKGIDVQKVQVAASEMGGAAAAAQFNIMVDGDQAIEAMSILNRAGLPRQMGTNLLTLFAKSGLMSSDREETIRYQAGLAEELQNTIQKFDGVLDADVQISFPPESTTPGVAKQKVTAAVFVKHQGILDDPNSHLDVKIKRLMAGSVNGLDYDNVSVISDRARIADTRLSPVGEIIGGRSLQQTYVSIWGIVMTKASLARFRFVFFLFIFLILLLAAGIGWLIYKFYPQLRASFSRKEGSPPETPL